MSLSGTPTPRASAWYELAGALSPTSGDAEVSSARDGCARRSTYKGRTMTTAVAARPGSEGTLDGNRPQQVADVFVIFGITGDLAKVMTFNSLYRLEERGLLRCPIIGVAVSDWSDDDLRAHAREAILNCSGAIDVAVFDRLAARMSYVSGDFGQPETYERVSRAIGDARCPVFYLEIPPFLFGRVVKGLTGSRRTARVRNGRDLPRASRDTPRQGHPSARPHLRRRGPPSRSPPPPASCD